MLREWGTNFTSGQNCASVGLGTTKSRVDPKYRDFDGSKKGFGTWTLQEDRERTILFNTLNNNQHVGTEQLTFFPCPIDFVCPAENKGKRVLNSVSRTGALPRSSFDLHCFAWRFLKPKVVPSKRALPFNYSTCVFSPILSRWSCLPRQRRMPSARSSSLPPSLFSSILAPPSCTFSISRDGS